MRDDAFPIREEVVLMVSIIHVLDAGEGTEVAEQHPRYFAHDHTASDQTPAIDRSFVTCHCVRLLRPRVPRKT